MSPLSLLRPPAVYVIAALVIIAAIYATYRAAEHESPRGPHRRLFADPAETDEAADWDEAADRDGTVTQAWLKQLHHAEQPEQPELPAAGRLAIEPVPPLDDTRPQPVIKDVAACELGMSTQDYVDGVFAPAEASLNAMVATYYAEVTR